MNVAFQVETLTNSEGAREIVKVECAPTTGEASIELDAQEIAVGSWEFQFVVPGDFDDAHPLFKKFGRYGLTAQTVCDACSEAWRSTHEDAVST